MKVFALVAILPILVQAGPVIPRSCDSTTGRHNACLMYREELHSRQFGDFFSGIGDLFGGGDDNNGGGGGFGDIVDTVGGLFGGGNDDNNANGGGGGGLGNIINTVGGLFGGGNDDDNAAGANAGANNNAGGGLGNIVNAVGGLLGGGDNNANANNNNGGGLGNIVNAVGGLINGGNDNNANGGNGGLGNILNTVGGLLSGGNNANAGAGAAVAQQAPPAAQAPPAQAAPAQAAPAQQAPPAAAAPAAIDDAAADIDPAAADPAAAAANTGAQCSAALPGINQATVGVIQEFEGFEDVPRPDPIGLPTAGFGHLCQQRNCAEVTAAGFSFPLSQQEGVQLLQNDIGQFTKCLNDMINDSVVLNENQFGALTSFTFNLGCRTVQRSTLMRRLNAGENPNTVAAQEMPKFRLANGKVFNGLVRRRAAEVALFQTPSNTVALPVCN